MYPTSPNSSDGGANPGTGTLPLGDIQANILRGHGRDHCRCLFLQFSGSRENIGHWIARQIAPKVTTANDQMQAYLDRKSNPQFDGGTVICFFLSKQGWDKTGASKRHLPQDDSFQKGMKHKDIVRKLADLPPGKWHPHYQAGIDAMVLIADDRPENLETKEVEILKSLTGIGLKLFTEHGSVIRPDPRGYTLEHFGFADGISQPVFLDSAGHPIGGLWKSVLVPEKAGGFGSFLVFRKLEQNVKAFKDKVRALAAQLNVTEEYAGAQVIGRFQNGTPLRLFDTPQSRTYWNNNFDYQPDTEGSKCPFHAHIRKVNPRDPSVSSEKRLIARRGITYDEAGRDPLLRDEPERGVGLLFMCYQASITEQFEYVQGNWCNDPAFPGASTGIDPINGQGNGSSQAQQWNLRWGAQGKASFSIIDLVTLKGGEYFYAASIPFLKKLAN